MIEPAVQVNAELLARADAMQAQTNERGQRLYTFDSKHRHAVEEVRRSAYTTPAELPKPAPRNTTDVVTVTQANGARVRVTKAQAERYAATGSFSEPAAPAPQQPAEGQPSNMNAEPNAEAVAFLNRMQSYRDPKTNARLYETDPTFRTRLEAARAQVYRGESIANLIAGTEATMRGEAPPAPTSEAEPAVDVAELLPTGTDLASLKPEHRAGLERVAAGDVVDVGSLPPSATFGYTVALPENFGLGAVEIDMLRTARRAGLGQNIIDAYIRSLTAQ